MSNGISKQLIQVPSQISGLTNGQVLFGNPSGGISQSSNLQWNDTTGNLGVGRAPTAERIALDGDISSNASLAGAGLNGFIAQSFDTTNSVTRISRFYNQLLGSGTGRSLFYAASNYADGTGGRMSFITENGAKTLFDVQKSPTLDSMLDVWSSTAATIRLHSNGTTYFNSGDVAIGTTNANGYKLKVAGNISMTSSSMLDWGSGNARIIESGYSLIFQNWTGTALTEKMRILGNGNVGIGTTAPGAGLEVASDNSTKSNFFVTDTRSFAESVGGQFYFRGKYNTAGGYALLGRLSGNKESATDGETKGYLSFQTNNGGSVSNLSEKMRILGNGNVGIGTTAPTATLHLKAGTATAGTAPLKLTSGINLTTPEDGAFEFDGTNLYFTVGGIRKTVTLV